MTRTKNTFLHIVKRTLKLFVHSSVNEKLMPCNHNFLGFCKTVKEAHWCPLNGYTVAWFGLALFWGGVFLTLICSNQIFQRVPLCPRHPDGLISTTHSWVNADGNGAELRVGSIIKGCINSFNPYFRLGNDLNFVFHISVKWNVFKLYCQLKGFLACLKFGGKQQPNTS